MDVDGTYPNVKQTEKAIPTKASDLDRVKGVVTSEMIALSLSENRIQSYQYNGGDTGWSGAGLLGELNITFAKTSDETRDQIRGLPRCNIHNVE